MSRLRTAALAILVVGLAPAAQARPPCSEVLVTTVAVMTSEQCDTPVGLCTVGTLESDFGLLRNADFQLTVTELEVCGEDLLCYEGILVITAPAGELILEDEGQLDVAAGTFTDTATIVGGTGPLADLSGTLSFEGTIEGLTLHGTGSGTICR